MKKYLCAPKEIVLDVVKRLGRATSKDVAFELLCRGFRCSEKAISMRLLHYYRQGLLGRARLGRSGFVYRIAHKGEERLRYLEQHQRKYENLVASNQIARVQSRSQGFFDKQLRELLLDFALAKYVTSPVRPHMCVRPNSEMDLFYLWINERDKSVQYEEALKEFMEGNRELMKTIVDKFVKPARASIDFELGRSIGKLEARQEILRESNQHAFQISGSFQDKKGARDTGLQKQNAQSSTQILKKTMARPRSFTYAFPMPSTQTLKIMRDAMKDVCEPAPLQKKAVAGQTDQNKDEWDDVNSWWRHL